MNAESVKRHCRRSFEQLIRDDSFPCVGAKAALARGQMEFVIAADICSNWDDVRVATELIQFARNYKRDPLLFSSLIVIYEHPTSKLSEVEFEHQLWQRLQSFSDKDSLLGSAADPRVASDPSDGHFSLSFGGEAFFVVGLHPGASRPARRFAHPALVFNPHSQFEQLRGEQRYEPIREKITARDLALAGSINPMLARHGESSEARQYSGRVVDDDWRCPFERRSFAWPALEDKLQ